MTVNDLKQYSNYLHKILNDKLYEILHIFDKEIIILFKIFALTKLQ